MSYLRGGKESEARRKYKIELIAERMTDMMVGRFVNDAMQWGTATEPFARAKYEEVTGEIVELRGLATHGDIPCFGASPDGLVGDDGLVEIKCPTTTTFVEWLIGGEVPEQHKPQMLAQLAVTGRKWVDFFAFDPRIKGEEQKYFLRRFEPDADDIKIEEAAKSFLADVDELFLTIFQEGV